MNRHTTKTASAKHTQAGRSCIPETAANHPLPSPRGQVGMGHGGGQCSHGGAWETELSLVGECRESPENPPLPACLPCWGSEGWTALVLPSKQPPLLSVVSLHGLPISLHSVPGRNRSKLPARTHAPSPITPGMLIICEKYMLFLPLLPLPCLLDLYPQKLTVIL